MREIGIALFISIAVHLCGCASVESAAPAYRWSQRPVTVYINEEMSPECLDSAEDALLVWRRIVDYLNVEYVTAIHPQILGLDRPGSIAITEGPLSSGVGGETRVLVHEHSGNLHFAHVTLALCKTSVAIHETGHSLGLPDVNDPENVMNWYTVEDGKLTEEQKDQVR